MSYPSGLRLNKGIRPNTLEFLQWWWCNLSINHPFHFRCDAKFKGSYVHPLEGGLPVQEDILVTLLALAQHLDINGIVTQMIPNVRPKLTFPNLETLRIRTDSTLSRPLSFLRNEHRICKLHIQGYELFKKPVIWWSSLTHLVFDEAYISSRKWSDLIRACVNLQFGYFDIRIRGPDDPHSAKAPYFTHQHLRQLVVGWDDHGITGKYMLKNLLLSALTAF